MNTFLWILQVLLAMMFGMSGAMKAFSSKEKLAERMAFAADMPGNFLKVVGVLELMGMAGMVLPGLTRILPILTPIAAVGLVMTMVGALLVHIPRKETMMVGMNVMLLVMAAFVAYGRFVVAPL